MKQNIAYKAPAAEQDLSVGPYQGLADASIVWKSIPGKGRGVFTTRDIKKGAIIEVAPVVPVAKESVPDEDAPDGYVLDWDDEEPGQEYAMALGYIMLYNHSKNPNIELESDLEEITISAIAIRDIKAGEELTWDYGCEIWFEAAE